MKRNYFIVFLVLVIFFVISFITNLIGPLVPSFIDSFKLSLFLAGFMPLAFFIAYGVMSIPAGILVDKYKEKKIVFAAFIIVFSGTLLFSLLPYFATGLISLFMIGIGMTMLQVAINPLLRVAGGEEHFAFTSVMGQLFFGAAGFVGPFLFTYIVKGLPRYSGEGNFLFDILKKLAPENLNWISMYIISAIVALVMIIIVLLIKFPKVELKEDEKVDTSIKTYLTLLKDKYVILFFFGIFAYVGTEQGIVDWMSKFLNTYHGFDTDVTGASAVGWFWLLMSIGCLVGLILLKLFDCRKILIIASIISMVTLTLAIFGPANVALYAFPLLGFFVSVMWSIIFSLALNSVPRHHGSFSGILCTGIIGGALLPPIIGFLGDAFELRVGLMFLYLTLGYILIIGIWAKPLINNKTITLKELIVSLNPLRISKKYRSRKP